MFHDSLMPKKNKTHDFDVYIFRIKYLGIFQPQGIIYCVLGTWRHAHLGTVTWTGCFFNVEAFMPCPAVFIHYLKACPAPPYWRKSPGSVQGENEVLLQGLNENLLLGISKDFSGFLVKSSFRGVILLQFHLNFKCTSINEQNPEYNWWANKNMYLY